MCVQEKDGVKVKDKGSVTYYDYYFSQFLK